MSTTSIEKLDRNFAPIETTADTVWYDVRDLTIEGRGWSDVASFYDRLPARAEALVRPEVWALSRHSAGIAARFVAETTSFAARWTVRYADAMAMPHMPATGVSGLDLYGRVDGQWRHAANGRPGGAATTSVTLIRNMTPVRREYTLYLPLYNGVESVHLGLPPGATLAPAPLRAPGRDKPIVIYGTSVTQGGCASRPGMAWPAILGRRLEVPVINLGFSGNGRMEMEVGRLLAELDPSIYVIDCLGNMDATQIAERTEPLVRLLRDARPGVPIVLLGNIPYTNMAFETATSARFASNNAALESAFGRLVAAGVPRVHHVRPDAFYGDDGEATVDCGHASDLGFVRIADALEPVLQGLL